MKSNPKATGVYSKGEMRFVVPFQKLKNSFFMPFNILFTKLGITATHLTIVSGVVAAASLVLSLYLKDPIYFVYGIWIHFLIDGIDGTLARFQNKVSRLGSLTDVIADHIGIVCSGLYLIYFSFADASLALIYTVLYTIIIYNAFIFSGLGIAQKYLMRPRLFIYISLTVDYFWPLKTLDPTLIFFSVLMLISSIEGIIKIANHIKQNG